MAVYAFSLSYPSFLILGVKSVLISIYLNIFTLFRVYFAVVEFGFGFPSFLFILSSSIFIASVLFIYILVGFVF